MAIQENPYLPPTSRVADAAVPMSQNYIDRGRAVPAGNALKWLGDGWRIFRRQAGIWILLTIAFFLIVIGFSIISVFIPVIGQIAGFLFMPIMQAGMMVTAHKSASGEDIELPDLFAGFRRNTGTLALVGAIVLGLMFVVGVVMAIVMGAAFAPFMTGSPSVETMGATSMLAFLITVALFLPIYMALFFAPALVILNDQKAIQALTQSFWGCLKNIIPFILYGIVVFVLAFFASLPLFLGWLILMPVLFASIYSAYRDIFFS